MKVLLNDKAFMFEIETYLKVFYPSESTLFIDENKDEDTYYRIIIKDHLLEVSFYRLGLSIQKSSYSKEALDKMNFPSNKLAYRRMQKRLMKSLIYEVATKITKYIPPWGILTGIRPTKVVFNLIEKHGYNKELLESILANEYKISLAKIKLLFQVVEKEWPILMKNKEDEINIYIGIPFCPSKCLYCSFTSYSINQYHDKIEDYLDALEKEIISTKSLYKDRPIRTIYIGGGTPTSLDAYGLKRLMEIVADNFDVKSIQEFTVEAGRPDTITEEKLGILKDYRVNRISINPQSMNENTLKLIGRNHSIKDVYRAFDMANKIGFDSINLDLIVGLPGEYGKDLLFTLNEIRQFNPTNITIHVLALKRFSRLYKEKDRFKLIENDETEEMLMMAANKIKSMGLDPYYMYRQKNMVGNFENVGYARHGKECIYNTQIIEEKESIIAYGAGTSSKIIYPEDNKIKRIENVKDIKNYIDRIDEMIARKIKG